MLLNARGSLNPVGVGIFPAQSFLETTRKDFACSKDNCLLLLFMIMRTVLEYTLAALCGKEYIRGVFFYSTIRIPFF